MKKMEWRNELSVGIDVIDNQHKQWIAHFNTAAEAVATKQNPAQISKTLGFLIDYTETHFATEEKFMTANHYAGFSEHKAKHDELRSTLANLVKDFEDEGVTSRLSDAIESFLGNWLVQHIQEIDIKFGDFVKREKIVLE